MTTKKSTGDTIPPLRLLAEMAKTGDYDSVLRGLCVRADARVAALFLRAVSTISYVVDNPKAAGWLAEAQGANDAGEIPDDSDTLVKALLERAVLHPTPQKNDKGA